MSADVELVLSAALRDRLDLPPQPNHWNEARQIIRDLAEKGIRVSATEEQELRTRALDQAARTAGAFDTGKTIRKRAERFLLFLRDGERGTASRPRGAAPDFVHESIDRAWATLREDDSGLKALEGEDGDEDVLEVLRGATDEDLRRASFVAQILRTLAQSVRAARG